MGENQYQPWIELGITELEYWKIRYLEARKEVAQLENGIRDCLRYANGRWYEWGEHAEKCGEQLFQLINESSPQEPSQRLPKGWTHKRIKEAIEREEREVK